MKRQKMRTEQKSNVKNSVGRLVCVGLSLLLQVLWILLLFLRLNAYRCDILPGCGGGTCGAAA